VPKIEEKNGFLNNKNALLRINYIIRVYIVRQGNNKKG
jgi:hypothetical protein